MSAKFDLSDQHVLITGAGGGIGQGMARTLASYGARLTLHYRSNASAVAALAEALNVPCVQADLTEPASVLRLLEETVSQQGVPTALVNNAADQSVGELASLSIEQWRSLFAANLEGVFYLTQQVVQRMMDASVDGSVVNISSIESLDPAPGHGHYASSKAALNMFTRACALEYGDRGIRVNAVSPGLIHRDGIETQWPEGVARWQERAPLGRLGTPQDVSDAVAFLISDAATWISGHNLVVDGGMSAQTRW